MFFLPKRVEGLPWCGLVRSGRPPKLTLERPTMAEAAEALRTGGASSGGAGSSSIRPELDAMKADPETEWMPVARRRRFRSKTPDLGVFEETDCGHWRQHQDGSDRRRNTKVNAGGDDRQ